MFRRRMGMWRRVVMFHNRSLPDRDLWVYRNWVIGQNPLKVFASSNRIYDSDRIDWSCFQERAETCVMCGNSFPV